jgi:virginiamycin B lyase
VGGLFAVIPAAPAHAGGTIITNYTDPSIGRPSGITAGPDGALWFTNYTNNTIGRISTDGVVTYTSRAGMNGPYAITLGPDGALWFTNIDSVGQLTTDGIGTDHTLPPYVGEPAGITAGPDGAVWFVSSGADNIDRITTAGVSVMGGTNDFPRRITAGPDGNLWITTSGNSILRITTGGVVTNYTDPSINDPDAITAGPDGALWFTNPAFNSIGRITTTGVVTHYNDPSIDSPYGITAGPDGALWFTNLLNNSIGRITTAGVVTNYTDPSISEPEGITEGPDRNLWFTNNGNNSIGRITPVGPPVSTVSSVSFFGTTTTREVAITGSGFGPVPPYPSYPAAGGCGPSYTYASSLYLQDITGSWEAGHSTPGFDLDCVGLLPSMWSNNKIVFGFGSDYGSNGWVLNPGDSYALHVYSTVVNGTVSFTAPFVAVAPHSGFAGTAVIVRGRWFLPGDTVQVTYQTRVKPPDVLLCSVTAAGDGSFTCWGYIPFNRTAGPKGAHQIVAKATPSGLKATNTYTRT